MQGAVDFVNIDPQIAILFQHKENRILLYILETQPLARCLTVTVWQVYA